MIDVLSFGSYTKENVGCNSICSTPDERVGIDKGFNADYRNEFEQLHECQR